MSSSKRSVTPRDDLNIPPDSDSLINQLNQALPHRCISVGEDEISAHRYAAQRELIDELLAMREEDKQSEIDHD